MSVRPVVTKSNHSQMSGSQMMKNKEDVAAIMKAKQQAGMYYARNSTNIISEAKIQTSGREEGTGGSGEDEEVDAQ